MDSRNERGLGGFVGIDDKNHRAFLLLLLWVEDRQCTKIPWEQVALRLEAPSISDPDMGLFYYLKLLMFPLVGYLLYQAYLTFKEFLEVEELYGHLPGDRGSFLTGHYFPILNGELHKVLSAVCSLQLGNLTPPGVQKIWQCF